MNHEDVRTLLKSLRSDGYRIISYRYKNGTLTLGELPEGELPPLGLREKQGPALFQIEQTSEKTFFPILSVCRTGDVI